MGRIRNIGVALMLASVMAMGFGTTLSAASRKPGGGGGGKGNTKDGSVCEYLTAVISYEYTTPTVMLYTLSLYSYYGCGQ
jgi:hypothetical protein